MDHMVGQHVQPGEVRTLDGLFENLQHPLRLDQVDGLRWRYVSDPVVLNHQGCGGLGQGFGDNCRPRLVRELLGQGFLQVDLPEDGFEGSRGQLDPPLTVIGPDGFDAAVTVQPLLPVKAYAKLAAITFKDITGPLNEVAYAMAGAKDNKPTIMQAVALVKSPKGLDLVATDANRLALATIKTSAKIPETFAISAACVGILKNWKGRITLRFRKYAKTQSKAEGYILIFQNGPLTLQTDGTGRTYPNYRQILPAALQSGITVRKADLQQAVKVCSTVVGKDGTVRLVSKGRNLQVIGLVEGSDSMTKIPHRGRIQQAFQANFLMDMMAHIGGEVVDLRHAKGTDRLGGLNVAVFKNNGSLHLIMPFNVADWEKARKAKSEKFTGVTEATPVSHGNGAGTDDEDLTGDEGELEEAAA